MARGAIFRKAIDNLDHEALYMEVIQNRPDDNCSQMRKVTTSIYKTSQG